MERSKSFMYLSLILFLCNRFLRTINDTAHLELEMTVIHLVIEHSCQIPKLHLRYVHLVRHVK